MTSAAGGWRARLGAYADPKMQAMLALGFSSGLPFLLVFSTLSAWLTQAGVKRATIGFFSWCGLAFSFKYLWSPLVDRLPLPGLERLGRRKSWILLCQITMVLGFAGLAATDPATSIGTFALLSTPKVSQAGHRGTQQDKQSVDQPIGKALRLCLVQTQAQIGQTALVFHHQRG